jgi:bifunctional DNA-binding transcriptional regulator/antitoxin component of YhaV-PrlF toxin-antitoxin module
MKTVVQPKRGTARLRPKNQITLPEPVLAEAGVKVGDRFRVTVSAGSIHLEPVRTSYYGVFKGLWPDTWMDELRQGRNAWSRREPK